MSNWLIVWLVVTIMATIIEVATTELVSVWFIGGGLVSIILCLCGLEEYWFIQVPAFFCVSIILMLCFRNIIMKKFDKNTVKTNAETFIGKEYMLISDITFGKVGTIKINGVEWSVVGENDNVDIKSGTIVKIVGLKGNKYIVTDKL